MAGLQELQQRLITLRAAAEDKLTEKVSARQAVLTLAEQERGAEADLTVEETAEFRVLSGEIEKIQTQMLDFDKRIKENNEEIERSGVLDSGTQQVRKATSLLQDIREPAIYSKDNRSDSYLLDICRIGMNMDYTGRARERLMRHATDVETSAEYRKAATEARALSRVDGAGGYAVPPLWMMNEYIELARPGRPLANAVTTQPLPPGTDSINIPKLLTGTKTAAQTADNTAVEEQDLTDTSVTAPVKTISGQQTLAIQLLDQSPIDFDQVVFRDLVADYAAQVDSQVIAGTGTNGQVLGILNTSGIQTVAASAVTIQGTYSSIANAIQLIHGTRFLPPQAIFMHPRRWGFFQSLLDLQNRPLFLPASQYPMNAAGVLTAVASEQVVGNLQGLPIITDPNIPVTLGSETPSGDEDPILIMRVTDSILFESGIRTRALPEVQGQQLSVVLQVFGYLAFTAARYPQSAAEITGLTAPTFA
jgi:HK97 family phage major capsid protein